MQLENIILKLLSMNKEDAVKLFQAFLTPTEIEELSKRYAIVQELINGTTQREISKKLGVSISKITRGSNELRSERGGYIFSKVFQKNILKEIIQDKLGQIDKMPLPSIKKIIELQSVPRRTFLANLKNSPFAIIGEIKKSSPSSGLLTKLSTSDIAQVYINSNIDAISVLTDTEYFGGNILDILEVNKLDTNIPILRKDFILSKKQICESKEHNASAILLIVKAFKDNYNKFFELYNFAQDIGIEVLVEVENENELNVALKAKPEMIGVNSRNLATLEIDKSKFTSLFPKIPDNIYKIALSGINTAEDIIAIKHLCNAALIGTSICKLTLPEMEKRIHELKSIAV